MFLEEGAAVTAPLTPFADALLLDNANCPAVLTDVLEHRFAEFAFGAFALNCIAVRANVVPVRELDLVNSAFRTDGDVVDPSDECHLDIIIGQALLKSPQVGVPRRASVMGHTPQRGNGTGISKLLV
jgi:hypothetical protein